jgi:hypothetical protein
MTGVEEYHAFCGLTGFGDVLPKQFVQHPETRISKEDSTNP